MLFVFAHYSYKYLITFANAEEDNDAPVYETPTTSNASAVFMSLHSTDKMDDKQSDNTADQMNAHSEVKLLGKQTKTQKAKMLRLKKLKGTYR